MTIDRRSIILNLISAPFVLPCIAREMANAEAFLGRDWRTPAQSVTIRVSASGSLAQAMTQIARWSIPSGSRCVLQFEDGQHQENATIVVNHSDGARIAIAGNSQNPYRTRIICETDVDLIYVGAGQSLGNISGVIFEHTILSKRGLGSALLADEGGSILATNVHVDGFYYGFKARRNGSIRCQGSSAKNGGDCNFFAFLGGHISARGCLSSGAKDQANSLGSGFVAEYGGSIDCEGAQSSGNLIAGFYALSNGSIRAYRSRAFRNGFAGYREIAGGVIIAHESISEGNCGHGFVSDRPNLTASVRFQEIGNNRPAGSC